MSTESKRAMVNETTVKMTKLLLVVIKLPSLSKSHFAHAIASKHQYQTARTIESTGADNEFVHHLPASHCLLMRSLMSNLWASQSPMLYISTFVQSVSGLKQKRHALLRSKYYTLTFCVKQTQKGTQGAVT